MRVWKDNCIGCEARERLERERIGEHRLAREANSAATASCTAVYLHNRHSLILFISHNLRCAWNPVMPGQFEHPLRARRVVPN